MQNTKYGIKGIAVYFFICYTLQLLLNLQLSLNVGMSYGPLSDLMGYFNCHGGRGDVTLLF